MSWSSRRVHRKRKTVMLFLFFCLLPGMMGLSGCLAYGLEQERAPSPVPESLPGEEEHLWPEKGSGAAALPVSAPDNPAPAVEPPLNGETEQAAGEREALRGEALGPFYVPLPEQPRDNPPVKARGIYLTGHSVGLEPRFRQFLELVENSELNAMVIDVKDDHGLLTYRSAIPFVAEVGADRRVLVQDMEAVLAELQARGIYTIGRVVIFKDPHLAEQRPEWAIRRKGGGLWRDPRGVAWIDPYQRQVWEYNLAVAREAALLGFREIQLDYVRFPENAHLLDREADYPARDHREKDELIREFIIHVARELEPYHVYLSADVFGVIATSWGDSDRIGQTWEMIAPLVDYICPMVYPSHYGPGYFGFAVPDAHPREIVHRALSDALKRSAPLERPGIIRPWLQSFTAAWVPGHIPYGPAEIRAQIEAAHSLGIDEYLLWNASNRYQPAALLPAAEAEARFLQLKEAWDKEGRDALGRTAARAVEVYLEAVRRGDWREAFSLHHQPDGLDFRSYPAWKETWTFLPVSYRVDAASLQADGTEEDAYKLRVDLQLKGSGGAVFRLYGDSFRVVRENSFWRVQPSPTFLDLLAYDGSGIIHGIFD